MTSEDVLYSDDRGLICGNEVPDTVKALLQGLNPSIEGIMDDAIKAGGKSVTWGMV